MSNTHIETSVIAEDASVSGEIEFVGTMIIQGMLEGDLKGADVIVQKTGKVTGNLDVNSINCHGTIEGDIKTKEMVAHSSARLDGQIYTQSLEVAPGAKMNGQLSMNAAQQSMAKNAVAPKKSSSKPKPSEKENTKLSDLVLD